MFAFIVDDVKVAVFYFNNAAFWYFLCEAIKYDFLDFLVICCIIIIFCSATKEFYTLKDHTKKKINVLHWTWYPSTARNYVYSS